MALSTTLAMAFAGRAFVNLGTEAGLSSDQIQKAVEVLRSAVNNVLNTYTYVNKTRKTYPLDADATYPEAVVDDKEK